MFRKFFLFFAVLTAPLFAENKDKYLVCLHGFLGGSWNMHYLEKNLKKEGWDVINWGYPSRNAFIIQHGESLVKKLIVLAELRPGKAISFVVHSMGSLVLLAALNHPMCPVEAKVGKVVLIAPPLKGTSWGRWLRQFSLARWIAKSFSGHELMTKMNFDDLGNYPDTLENILVIAGSFGFNPLLTGANDGTIALHETSLAMPHERSVVKCGHKTLIYNRKVYTLINRFLQTEKIEIPSTI